MLMDLMAGHVPAFDEDGTRLPRWIAAAEAARSARIPVVFVRVAFRPGHPEVVDRNRVFSVVRDGGRLEEGDLATAVHADLGPEPGDIVVTKRRISAFAGSDLDAVLRGLDVDTLVLAGISTSGVVLGTVVDAADLDFELVVLADACIDPDEELHRALTERFFPQRGTVTTTGAWIASLAAD